MTNKPRPVARSNPRGFSMLVAVGMMGIVTLAVLATSAMFTHQAKRTRLTQQQAQQRQLEIAKVLLGDESEQIKLPQ
ncbi:MAG TPA: hypothetical protein DCM28_22430 [Phycisphaerales bacterium]|nr:hypothetical protein [Phycisphaerales bacterium]HCD31967.1 hypothetical protein [Phycisphaerales bacterium]|tara:strand:+ start:475 stop:705 length:231 start_codon:yes stop_codon:yes gene_type:complete